MQDFRYDCSLIGNVTGSKYVRVDVKVSLHDTVIVNNVETLRYLLSNRCYVDIDGLDGNKCTALQVAVHLNNGTMVNLLLDYGASLKARNGEGKTALHIAAENGSTEMVELLLQRGACINIASSQMYTPLHLAVKRRRYETVKLLLRRRAKVNTQNSKGNSPLHTAVNDEATLLVRLLLSHGANPNCKNKYEQSPFFESFTYRSKPLFRLLLGHGANVNQKGANGENGLHMAALCCTRDMVERMLDRGMNVNQQTHDGWTPLHYAVNNVSGSQRVHLEIVKLLVERGANVELRDRQCRTPLILAVQKHLVHVAEYLVSVGAKVNWVTRYRTSALSQAADDGDFEMLSLLLRNGAKANYIDYKKETPLHVVVRNFAPQNRYRAAKMLLKSGCRIDVQNAEQKTPFHIALEKIDLKMFQLLLKHGASIHLKGFYDMSPLQIAVKMRFLPAVKKLIAVGADVNDRNKIGISVLSEAVLTKDAKLVELLLQHGATLDDKRLMVMAAAKGEVSVMNMLVIRGANVEDVDPDGMTVLFSSIVHQQAQMLQYLLEHGADVNRESRNNWLPLTCALATLAVRRTESTKQVLYVLLKHLALLEVQGIAVSTANMKLLESQTQLTSIYAVYKAELESMKHARVSEDTTITYYDLLVKRGNDLVRCVRNEHVRTAFNPDHCRAEFKKYSHQVEENFLHGIWRMNAVDKVYAGAYEALHSVLPAEIVSRVVELYSNIDLKLHFQN